MKKAASILLLVLIAAAAAIWYLNCPCCTRPVQPSRETPAPPPVEVAQPQSQPDIVTTPEPELSPEGQPPAAHDPDTPATTNFPSPAVFATTPPPARRTTPKGPEAIAAQQALEILRTTFQNYGQRFKGNPVGNNAEITKALNGENPGGAHFLGENPNLNGKGELVDGWGTPYFFHQLGGYEMEIHSAGPDKKMGTADDLVTR
jgi:hypothetical protein